MGFFFVSEGKTDKNLKGLSPDFLRRHECNVCPLNGAKGLQHPKMLPTGSKTPTILMVSDSPSASEDAAGKLFVGVTGRLVRERIPKQWQDKIRYTTIVNCRSNDEADNVAAQCCASRFERDVAATKPKAIFGFGPMPLFRIIKQTGINLWRERRIPVNIGGHACWFYPMLHPQDVIKKRKFQPRDLDSYGSDEEFAFALDLKRAFAEVDNLPEPLIHSVDDAVAGIELLTDINRVAERLNAVASDPTVGVDLETNCLRPYSDGAKILSAAFSSKSYTFAFPLDHSQASWSKLERKQLDVLIKRFLYESKCRKISHHLPFELEWLGLKFGTGCFYASRWEDSESQAYILDARRGSASLDFLCLQYFGLNLKAISGLDRKNLDKSPINQVLKYNAIDARYHRLLFLEQQKRIKEEKLQEVYNHQIRRIPALVLATMQGVPVDQTVVERLKKKYKKRADEAARAIEQEEVVDKFEEKKGRKFNPGSPQDVSYLLKTVLGLEIESTEKTELAHIEHPIAKMIVQYREPMKVLGTYIESIDAVSKDTNLFPDGMLHPIISTTTVKTWRSSSDGPNIQNFPKHDEELKEVRTQVKSSDPNIVVVSIDYAGIQARNVAMESRDKKLVDVYWHNYDIHSDWRDRIVKKYPKWIPKSKLNDKEAMKGFRQAAKNKFVFATFFGAQSYTTSEGLGIPRNICEELREEFFDEFKDIGKWHKQLHDFYYKNGYVMGLSGFRRYAPVSGTELINTPIQSDESIIVLDAMARLSELQDPRYQAALEVHDDLTFFWPKKEVEKRLEVVVKEMINIPFEWANIVPIAVEASWGPDWINMTKIGEYSNDKWNGIVEIKERM